MRPRKISIRHNKQASRAELLSASTSLAPTSHPFVTAVQLPFNATLLRIGDYLLGEPDCPSLYGHPEIRY
ncbi:hypothetical protein [Hymenobacter sp. GOD-10R]|uniref:hypothetical protein n=1 Tax=Hymenobacter sp. GOD-10R TaxID=3093922 RepID=UPI002D766A00|nr:hypothetical protein [Hymenobacter sp. GOD-10R]WRQ28296.1 hypothetical protein SD425_24825 [Hymenobacter sp. GOD-10R]